MIFKTAVLATLFLTLTVLQINGDILDCPRPFEEYACGSACQRKCSTLGETCKIINVRCNDACYCIDGYARDKHDNCIPISQCPPKRGSNI